MRQLLQAIRKNIEKMRFHMEKISNAYQASVEKSKPHYFVLTHFSTLFQCKFFIFQSMCDLPTHSSYIQKYGRASTREHNGVSKSLFAFWEFEKRAARAKRWEYCGTHQTISICFNPGGISRNLEAIRMLITRLSKKCENETSTHSENW